MWPRKQLDIEWNDFAFGARKIVSSRSRPAVDEVVGHGWIPPREALIALSVRTGWDLLLSALQWPRGSEIVMSAVTIPDMPRIAEHHGLVPVPVAVDANRLEPLPDNLDQAITPRTRAILVAHLFGSRVDMTPIVDIARRHDLVVVEDCAQAYVGPSYAGHNDSDVALFSFGPIKTATALGGAVLRIRDLRLRDHMDRMQHAYPIQSRAAYAARLAKYAACSVLSWRRVFGAAASSCAALGIDFDRAFAQAAHSFSSAKFFDQIRRQPCVPLVRMLQRRHTTFGDNERLRRRTSRGWHFAGRLPPHAVPGAENQSHTYWVLPVHVENPARALTPLRAAGFDATSRSSLVVVPATGNAGNDARRLAPWLRETIFLPNGDDMPDDEFDRMLAVLSQATGRRQIRCDSEHPGDLRVPAAT